MQKISQVHANMVIKKKSAKKFCCYDKKQQIRKFSQDFRAVPRWCTQNFFQKIFVLNQYLKICKFSFSQKFIFMSINTKEWYWIQGGGILCYVLCICNIWINVYSFIKMNKKLYFPNSNDLFIFGTYVVHLKVICSNECTFIHLYDMCIQMYVQKLLNSVHLFKNQCLLSIKNRFFFNFSF